MKLATDNYNGIVFQITIQLNQRDAKIYEDCYHGTKYITHDIVNSLEEKDYIEFASDETTGFESSKFLCFDIGVKIENAHLFHQIKKDVLSITKNVFANWKLNKPTKLTKIPVLNKL